LRFVETLASNGDAALRDMNAAARYRVALARRLSGRFRRRDRSAWQTTVLFRSVAAFLPCATASNTRLTVPMEGCDRLPARRRPRIAARA
jgi:hypothetical protein